MYPTSRPRSGSPRLEALEGRVLLSGSPAGKSALALGVQALLGSSGQSAAVQVETSTAGKSGKAIGQLLTKLLVGGDRCGCDVNKPPVAVADQATTPTGKAVSISVLTNDKDPEGGPLTLVCVGPAAKGTVTLDPAKPGVVTYTPQAGFAGEDCFTYTVRDAGGKTATAPVKVKVDGPTGQPSTANRPPVAADDKVAAHAGKAVTVNVLGNDKDPDGDALTLTAVTQPAKGTVKIENGKAVYTPGRAFVGTDRFTYTVRDAKGATATATVVVEYGNKPPVAAADAAGTKVNQAVAVSVLANDKDADGDALKVSNFVATTAHGGQVKRDPANANRLIYTPPKDYVGEDSFTYTASDGLGGTAEGCVKLVVTPPPCPTPPIPTKETPIITCEWFGCE
ncbi:MAG: Ig-like domain-containing protein [Gemmataceae bacterium]